MKQGDAAWFEARQGKITGSRIGAILGLSPWQKPDDVMREMVREHHGAEREFTGNQATAWGSEHESDAVAAYECLSGNLVEQLAIVQHPVFPFLAYSPDGYVGDDLLIECKCPASQKIPAEIPPHYFAQVQLGMEVMNLTSTDFVYWTPADTVIFRIERDGDWMQKALPALQDFHDRFTQEISNPAHLEPLVQHMDSAEWDELAREYRFLKDQIDSQSGKLDSIKQRLIELSGDRAAEGNGLKLTPYVRAGSVDYKAIPELKMIDLEQFRKPGGTSYRITLE